MRVDFPTSHKRPNRGCVAQAHIHLQFEFKPAPLKTKGAAPYKSTHLARN